MLLGLTHQGPTQSADTAGAAAIAQKLVKAHSDWTQMSSPGASIEAKEVLRDGSNVQYHFFVRRMPGDKLYKFYSWSVKEQEPADQMEGISIEKNGLLICAGRTPQQCGDASQKDNPIEFTFSPGHRVAFISADARVAMVLVPDPIRSKDKNCTLEVVRLLPNFELCLLCGQRFCAERKGGV